MAYGTTLDSLNNAILQEKAQRADEANGFRNYLLGLAGERNRGRQVDVNAMDAGTRREGLGVQERLGNRQWDTEGRRVDVLGRDVDMRERVGMGQIGVQKEDIAARERIAAQDADVRRRGLDIDEMYKRALAGDLAAARRLQELGITTSAGLEGRRIDLTEKEIGERYKHFGRQMDINERDVDNRYRLGLGQVGVAMTDAETRAQAVANQYNIEINRLIQTGRIEEARLAEAAKDRAVRRELGLGALENDRTRAGATKTLAEAQAYGIMNPSPSDAMRVNVADRNAAEQAAYNQAGPIAAMLNNKINSTDGWFDFQNPEVVNDMLLSPQVSPSLKYLVEDPKTHMWSVNPAARPIMTDLVSRPARPAAPSPSPQPSPSAAAPAPAPAPAQTPAAAATAPSGYRPPTTWSDAAYGRRYGTSASRFPAVDPYMLYGGELPSGNASEPEPLPDLVLPPMPPPRSGERWLRGGEADVQARRQPQAPGRQIPKLVILPDGTAAWE